jgi:thioredoxin 1
MKRALVIAAVTTLAAGAVGCGSASGPRTAPSGPATSSAAAAPAPAPAALPKDLGYVDYAAYAAHRSAFHGRTVVLFYWASWCPNCAAHEATIQTAVRVHTLPPRLSIVKVDYDDNDVRKVGYSVTSQDTFVLVDATGKALRKPLVGPAYGEILALAT